jgi:excisionase family DNA binding protein
MNSEVLTVQEVANYLRIDIRTVYRLAKRGDIPCIKIGRQWRFNREDIKDLVGGGHQMSPFSSGTSIEDRTAAYD